MAVQIPVENLEGEHEADVGQRQCRDFSGADLFLEKERGQNHHDGRIGVEDSPFQRCVQIEQAVEISQTGKIKTEKSAEQHDCEIAGSDPLRLIDKKESPEKRQGNGKPKCLNRDRINAVGIEEFGENPFCRKGYG